MEQRYQAVLTVIAVVPWINAQASGSVPKVVEIHR